MPIAFAFRISSLWISSPLTGAPVTGSTQNIRLVVYQRVIPVLAICAGVIPLMGIVFGIGTLVHGTVCSK